MSLRIITHPAKISQWITDRNGTPVRRRGTDAEVRVAFEAAGADYETLTVDELLEAMKFHNLVMLVDQEAGKNFHKIYAHS